MSGQSFYKAQLGDQFATRNYRAKTRPSRVEVKVVNELLGYKEATSSLSYKGIYVHLWKNMNAPGSKWWKFQAHGLPDSECNKIISKGCLSDTIDDLKAVIRAWRKLNPAVPS